MSGIEIFVYSLYFYITGFISVFLLILLHNKIGLLYDYNESGEYKEWFIDYKDERYIFELKESLICSLLSWVLIGCVLVLFGKCVLFNSKYAYKFKNWFENK